MPRQRQATEKVDSAVRANAKNQLTYFPQVDIRRDVKSDGKSAGMEVIVIDNGRLRIAVLPGRGMGLWKIWVDGIEMGWQSPVRGPVHPMYVPLFAPDGLGWLEGFDEVLCRCGLSSNGAPEFDGDGKLIYPMHGRIANLPAEQIVTGADPLSGLAFVSGVVHESSFRGCNLALCSKLLLDRNVLAFDLCDTVTNHGSEPATIQLLYHYNLGAPILGAHSTFVAPVRSVSPRDAAAASGLGKWSSFSGPTIGFKEQVFYSELNSDSTGNTMVLLKNSTSTLAASVGFNRRQLPCFTLWKNTGGLGDGYVTGLEPGTNFPNARSTEVNAENCLVLEPGQSVEFTLGFGFHTNELEVARIEKKIGALTF
jgi:hypothetical protein